MTVLDDGGAAQAADTAVEIGPVALAALWAFVGAGVTAGAVVVVTETVTAEVRGGELALGLVLIAAAAVLGLVLGVRQLLLSR